jgi:hypothetical protein
VSGERSRETDGQARDGRTTRRWGDRGEGGGRRQESELGLIEGIMGYKIEEGRRGPEADPNSTRFRSFVRLKMHSVGVAGADGTN